MAFLLYSNGLSEEYKPKSLIFTESELIDLFKEFSEIRTCRLITMINTWCIYGISLNPDPMEFNRIAAELIKAPVYSHVLYVHDSEIDPKWNVTDSTLYKSYIEFLIEIRKTVDTVAAEIVNQLEAVQQLEGKIPFLPHLAMIGSTPDKRILFGFNPTEQPKEFYEHDEFYKFSQKVYDYISHNKQEKEPFTIYADKKAVIVIKKDKVNPFLETLLQKFQSKEEYEICVNITKIMKDWTQTNKPSRKKRSLTKPKSSESLTDEQ